MDFYLCSVKSDSIKPFSLKREEILKSRKSIESLFQSGKSVKAFPVLLVWQESSSFKKANEAAFSVSKKRFKRAVDRNRIKRLMREAYRLNKHMLKDQAENEKTGLQIMFIYTGKTIPTFLEAEKKIIECMSRLKTADKSHS